MFETITTGFIFLLFGVVAGLGVDIALKRIFELESPVDEGSSSTLPGIAEKVSNVVSQLAPISRSVMESTRDSLDRAGLTMQPATFWAFRVASAAGFIAAGLIASVFIGGAKGLGVFAAMVLMGLAVPQLWLFNERSKWRDELDRQLPDALDLLAICMSAGSSIDFALHTVGSRMDGAIARGFERVANEASFSSRTEALLRFAERARAIPHHLRGVVRSIRACGRLAGRHHPRPGRDRPRAAAPQGGVRDRETELQDALPDHPVHPARVSDCRPGARGGADRPNVHLPHVGDGP